MLLRNLNGKRFGSWVVIGRHEVRNRHTYWPCRCDCGTERLVDAGELVSGGSLGCAQCGRKKTAKSKITHGRSDTPLFRAWCTMRARCENPKHNRYAVYGGRGIRVCERWQDFAAFYEDMGDPPDGCSLDRIDANGHYEPGNCRWATRKKQQRNTSRNRTLILRGEKLCLAEAVERLGLSPAAVRQRLRRGSTISAALGLNEGEACDA